MISPDYSKLYKDKKEKKLEKVSTFRIIKSFVQDGKLLDIACGTGYLLNFLEGGTGIDLNPKLINEAKSNYPNNKFFVSDCTNIILPDNSFDTIVMCMIIEHLKNPDKTLLEAKRLLKGSGNLIIVTPRKNDIFYRLFVEKDPTHFKEYTTKELASLVSKYFTIKNLKFGSVSTKIPGWITFLIKPDIIINCIKK